MFNDYPQIFKKDKINIPEYQNIKSNEILTLVKIDEMGLKQREVLLSVKESKFLMYPSSTYKVSDEQILLFGAYKASGNFGTVRWQ